VNTGEASPPADATVLPVVRAAGGVLWRRADDGSMEVAVVHRPRYDDWSLPKGKQDPGETDEVTALREVEEETGYVARIVMPLVPLDYVLPNGQPKVVMWFSMEVAGGTFEPNDEVDQLEWLALDAAARRLTRPTDGVLIELVGHLHGR
jgi:8-oxo-(d)GTP phosphatase